MAPTNSWDCDMPQPVQEHSQPASNESLSSERESNPFVAFRKLVDQQIESMFNVMIPASRYEDPPFWEQKEGEYKQHRPAQQTMNEEMRSFYQQTQDMEKDLDKEIARARQEAFKQLPWLWDAATSRDQKPETIEPRNIMEPTQNDNRMPSKHTHQQNEAVTPQNSPQNFPLRMAAVAIPPTSQPKPQDPGPETEEQAYLYLNFPHLRDQFYSLKCQLTSDGQDQQQDANASRLSHIGSLMRQHPSEIMVREEHLREYDRERERGGEDFKPDDLLSARDIHDPPGYYVPLLRKYPSVVIFRNEHSNNLTAPSDLLMTAGLALHNIVPSEHKIVGEQSSNTPHTAEERLEQRCPWKGRWSGNGEYEVQRDHPTGFANASERESKSRRAIPPQEKRKTPERTVKAPWWWLGAIWDPTFPREADSYGMRHCRPTSKALPSSHASEGEVPAAQWAGPWEPFPARPRSHLESPLLAQSQDDAVTSSLTTTATSTTQPDGSVRMRLVFEKRHPDGRNERDVKFLTQGPGEKLDLRQSRSDPLGELWFGRPTESKERNIRRERVRQRDVKQRQGEQQDGKARPGWFWAS